MATKEILGAGEVVDIAMLNKFQGMKNIPGIYGNFVVFAHGFDYLPDVADFVSTAEDSENEMVLGLCRHLLFNKVLFEQFQVMCNSKTRTDTLNMSTADAFKMINAKHTEVVTDDPVSTRRNHVTILVLTGGGNGDEHQEESYVNAILHAIKTSRNGVIIIAPYKIILEAESERWSRLLNEMFHLGYIHPFLTIHCETHCHIHKEITSSADLQEASPFGGCLQICFEKYCGHQCGSACHPYDKDHRAGKFKCLEPCGLNCTNGHKCIRPCSEPCFCGSKCPFVRRCGHPLNRKKECRLQCPGKLKCGHNCPKKCFACDKKLKKHRNVKCNQPCNRACQKHGHPCKSHPCFSWSPSSSTATMTCPPCLAEVENELLCGHPIKQKCSDPIFNEARYVCYEKCRRRYNFCGHPCRNLCFEDCGMCPEVYNGVRPGCGHDVTVPCGFPIVNPCQALVISRLPSRCGHEVMIPCNLYQNITMNETTALCRTRCGNADQSGYCGHECRGNCAACTQGKFHVRCDYACGQLLICGHRCHIACPMVCPPCIQNCMATCEHYKCPFECGFPCDHVCAEPCPYSCEHLSCSKTCGEICDRPGCNEPCPKMLNCGHPCCGFCGEICPQGCRICTQEILIDIVYSSGDDILRYIKITPCGHCVEESALRMWIQAEDNEGEILLKRCPICLQSIDLTLRRYSAHIRESWSQVQEIKRQICGDEIEMKQRLEDVKETVKQRLQSPLITSNNIFNEYANAILEECAKPIKMSNISGIKFDSMYMDRVKFIEWTGSEWIKAQDLLTNYKGAWNKQNFSNYMTSYSELFRQTFGRIWPLHPNEFNCINMELERIGDMERLFNRVSCELDVRQLQLANSYEGKQRFSEATAVLMRWAPYTLKLQEKFMEEFTALCGILKVTLEISEGERMQIVRAFGSKAGRWFKCPNGHVYVVTECGGMTELGTCNVCGAIIGGQNHQLVALNQLATEMDGAQTPMYPTVLQRQ